MFKQIFLQEQRIRAECGASAKRRLELVARLELRIVLKRSQQWHEMAKQYWIKETDDGIRAECKLKTNVERDMKHGRGLFPDSKQETSDARP